MSTFPEKEAMSAYQKPIETSPALRPGEHSQPGTGATRAETAQHISIGKTTVPREPDARGVLAEVFTMTLGDETIQLLPLKTWSQLDLFKWRARGILPGTPAGLEITWDHLKIAGQSASPWDPEACPKLEKAFNEWLALETQNLELAKEKAQASVVPSEALAEPDDEVVRFEIDPSKAGQPHIKCLEGREAVKTVALNLQGLNALVDQGFMRKPKSMKVGALHDWVELDGRVFRFKVGTNWATELEKTLNQFYTVTGEPDAANDVAIFANPASPTGFDIQFPATPSGVVENRKRHLNEETVQLLNDLERCRVLRKSIVVKLAPPDLVFKEKTVEGGERYLETGSENSVRVAGEDSQVKIIDLSQPISLLNLDVAALNAIFNHSSINRRARLARLASANQQ